MLKTDEKSKEITIENGYDREFSYISCIPQDTYNPDYP